MYKVIRKATINVSDSNRSKLDLLDKLFMESERIINLFIDKLWEQEDFSSKFVDFSFEDTWFSKRLQQCLGKQALEIVKSQRKKKIKSKPTFRNITLNLDSRFVKFLDITNSFDFWLNLGSLGNKLKLTLCGKKHRHYNKYSTWERKNSIRLYKRNNKYFIDVFFEKDIEYNNNTKSIGIDLGYRQLATTSEGNIRGTEISKKCDKIARKERGSKKYTRALVERSHYINKTLKDLDISQYSLVVLEDLKHMKRNSKKKNVFSRKFRNKFQYWVYSKALSYLIQLCETLGVQYHKVNPRNTSRTCYKCKHVDKESRKSDMFLCTNCNYSDHADINASKNILFTFLGRDDIEPCNLLL